MCQSRAVAASGKTTLGLQFLSRCTETEPGLLFGFYETPARLDAKIAQVCPSLRGLLDSGVVAVQWQPPTDDPLDAYGERLRRMVQQRRVRRLFIDGLGAMQRAAGAEPSRIGNFLTALMNEMRVLDEAEARPGANAAGSSTKRQPEMARPPQAARYD